MTIETEDVVAGLRKLVIMDEVGSDNPLGRDAIKLIQSLSDRIAVAIDALEAIKEFADADETQLCWKTANDALASLIKEGSDATG